MTRKGVPPLLPSLGMCYKAFNNTTRGNAAHEINGSLYCVCADRRTRRLLGRPYRGTVVDKRELAGVSCLFLPGVLDCLDLCGPDDGTEGCLTLSVFSEPPTRPVSYTHLRAHETD